MSAPPLRPARPLRPSALEILLLAVGAGLIFAAGTSGCDQGRLLGTRWVLEQRVAAAQGADLRVTPADSAELAGVALTIGPGDLSADSTLQLESGASALGGELEAAGPAVLWSPAGLTFARPVQLAVPYSLGAGQVTSGLFVLLADGQGPLQEIEHDELTVDAAAGVVRFSASRLGGFQAAAAVHCTSDADCDGVVGSCVAQQCRPPPSSSDGGSCTGFSCSCTVDLQCSPGYVCARGLCVPGRRDR